MMVRGLLIVSIFWLCTACHESPYAKWKVALPEDEELSVTNKISLITASAALSPYELAAAARLYASQENWNRALELLNKAIQKDPLNSSLHSLKARYAYNLGNGSVAYREALTAYQLGTKSLEQSLHLAKMAVALSEFSIVGNIIDSLLVAYPNDYEVLYMAARKYETNGNFDKATTYYERALTLNPENQDNIYHYANMLVGGGKLTEAKDVLDSDTTQLNEIRYNLLKAKIYDGLANYDSAIIFYKRTLPKRPDSTILNRVIALYQESSKTDSLISISRWAISQFPDDKRYLLLAARNLDKRYKFDDALVLYRQLYQLDTLDTLVREELSYLQRKIAYLQRKKLAEKKLADSLQALMPADTLKK